MINPLYTINSDRMEQSKTRTFIINFGPFYYSGETSYSIKNDNRIEIKDITRSIGYAIYNGREYETDDLDFKTKPTFTTFQLVHNYVIKNHGINLLERKFAVADKITSLLGGVYRYK